MAEKIIVEMTREQAQAVMAATELLARLEIGQFEEICWKMLDKFNGEDGFDSDRRDRAEQYLDAACQEVFGVNQYGRPNIEKKSMQHQRCWAVYATIRHALAWHDHPEGGMTVNFDKPMGYGEPLPKCEVRDDDKN